MANNLIIVGIDPGTTLGYAILDLNGNVLKLVSSKGINISSLILEVIKHGKVIAIGTDKARIPRFVEEFASHLGTKIINPEFDLGKKEKRKLVNGITKNKHETDALASAIYAYKKTKPFLNKLEMHLKNINREEDLNSIVQLIVERKANSISKALEI